MYHVAGVVGPTGEYNVLGVEEGANATIETGVFCARTGIKDEECDKVHSHMHTYLNIFKITLNISSSIYMLASRKSTKSYKCKRICQENSCTNECRRARWQKTSGKGGRELEDMVLEYI